MVPRVELKQLNWLSLKKSKTAEVVYKDRACVEQKGEEYKVKKLRAFIRKFSRCEHQRVLRMRK